MDSNTDFLRQECTHLDQTISLLGRLLAEDRLTQFEVIALGTLIQNLYMGLENIWRFQLLQRGISLAKTESWHKDLILKVRQEVLISEPEFTYFRDLLLFRHMHTHGYGHQLNETRLRELAAPALTLCRQYLHGILHSQ